MAFPTFTAAGIAGVAIASFVVALLIEVTYNLVFHPLARFPGPITWRASRLGFVHRMVLGQLPRKMLAIHDRYGPVVRVAPNELAFNSPEAWQDIYGHRKDKTLEELPKWTTFYRASNVPPSMIAETWHNHALMRRQLAPSFSDRALREQEPMIGSYIDLLIQRLRERASTSKDDKKQPLDLMTWYTWTTFDVIGDLAFGEPFGCLETAEDHPWVQVIFDSLGLNTIFVGLRQLGFRLVNIPLLRLLKVLKRGREEHDRRTREKMARRMAIPYPRPDLIEGLLRKKEEWNLDLGRLVSNASTIIVAGSETTATLLSGVTYLLLTHPEALRRVTAEVRAAFASEDEITLTSVGQLSYMLACLNEALRRYPPVSFGLPRIVPKGVSVTIAGEVVPENTVVSVWHWATYHSTDNFKDPFEYHPERFLHDPNYASDKLDALQPFSVGPRNCVGKNLAYAEMRLILARILYNFDMELAHPEVDWLDQRSYVLWKKHELPVYLTAAKRV